MKQAALRWMLVVLALGAAGVAAAGPLGWLHRRKHAATPEVVVSKLPREVVALTPGQRVHVRIGPESPTATVADERVRYLRFALPAAMAKARIELDITTQRHRTSPRFTVLAPQVVILDAGGEVLRTTPVQPLQLDIEPFQRTRLTGCVDATDLTGFLLTTDPALVGHDYEFNARTKAGKHPDRGFYNAHSSLQVFMRYADTGEAIVRVIPTPPDAAPCQPSDA